MITSFQMIFKVFHIETYPLLHLYSGFISRLQPNTPKKSSQERILLPCRPTIATPAHYFLNGYLLAISQENITPGRLFQQVIERHFYEENETYFRIVYLFAQGELACLKGNRRGLSQMKKAVDIFRILNCQHSADYYQDTLDTAFKNIVNNANLHF